MPFVLLIGAAILAYALASASSSGKASADGLFLAHDPLQEGGPAWASYTDLGRAQARKAFEALTVVGVEPWIDDFRSDGTPGTSSFLWHLMPLDPSATDTPSLNTTLATQMQDIAVPWRVWYDTSTGSQLILVPDASVTLPAPFALLTASGSTVGGKGW